MKITEPRAHARAIHRVPRSGAPKNNPTLMARKADNAIDAVDVPRAGTVAHILAAAAAQPESGPQPGVAKPVVRPRTSTPEAAIATRAESLAIRIGSVGDMDWAIAKCKPLLFRIDRPVLSDSAELKAAKVRIEGRAAFCAPAEF